MPYVPRRSSVNGATRTWQGEPNWPSHKLSNSQISKRRRNERTAPKTWYGQSRNSTISKSLNTNNKKNQQTTKCDGCGSYSHKYKSPACPAKDAKCNECKWKGHFASECRLKKSKQSKPQEQKKQGQKWNKKKWNKSKKVHEDTSESAATSSAGASVEADSVLEQLLQQTLSFD